MAKHVFAVWVFVQSIWFVADPTWAQGPTSAPFPFAAPTSSSPAPSSGESQGQIQHGVLPEFNSANRPHPRATRYSQPQRFPQLQSVARPADSPHPGVLPHAVRFAQPETTPPQAIELPQITPPDIQLVMYQAATPGYLAESQQSGESIIKPVSMRSHAPSSNHRCCSNGCCELCPHQSGAFVDYLLLQVSDADVPFAVLQNNGVPFGRAGVVDPGYRSGYRVGVNLSLDGQSSLTGVFTWFDASADEQMGVLMNAAPLVTYPGTLGGATSPSASASYDVQLRMGDLQYRSMWRYGSHYAIEWMAGIRGAHLDQDFNATFPFTVPAQLNTTVDSRIDFDGIGIRGGLNMWRQLHPDFALRVYGKTSGSLMAGEFEATYLQNSVGSGVQASTQWSDDRVVPVLDCELGMSWTNDGGNLQLSAGWMFQAWCNTVTTTEWIRNVQGNNFADSSDTLTFSGLVARLEFLLP